MFLDWAGCRGVGPVMPGALGFRALESRSGGHGMDWKVLFRGNVRSFVRRFFMVFLFFLF
jgi:hypothetical protein